MKQQARAANRIQNIGSKVYLNSMAHRDEHFTAVCQSICIQAKHICRCEAHFKKKGS